MEGKAKTVLLSLVLFTFLLNLFIWSVDIINSKQTWATILTIEGLFFDSIGAIGVLVPDITFWKGYLFSRDDIERLQKAKNRLFRQEKLNKGQEGFEDLVRVFRDEFDIDFIPDRIEAPSPGHHRGAYGSGGEVNLCVEKEDWTKEDYIEKLPEGREPKEHPRRRYEVESKIGELSLIRSLVEREINDMKNQRKDLVLRYGGLALLIGFLIQILSNILLLL